MIETNPVQYLTQAISQNVQRFFDQRLKGIFDQLDKRLKGISDQLKELNMKMETVLMAVNHAAENQEKELTLLTEIKASNDDLLLKLEAALNSDNVSAELEAAIGHLDAENEKVDQRIVELTSGGTGTSSTGTSGDGTGAGGIAPASGGDTSGTGTDEPGSGPSEPAEPVGDTGEPPTSGTL